MLLERQEVPNCARARQRRQQPDFVDGQLRADRVRVAAHRQFEQLPIAGAVRGGQRRHLVALQGAHEHPFLVAVPHQPHSPSSTMSLYRLVGRLWPAWQVSSGPRMPRSEASAPSGGHGRGRTAAESTARILDGPCGGRCRGCSGRPVLRDHGGRRHARRSAPGRQGVQVIAAIARGRTNQEVAADLEIMPTTVKTYLRNTMRKLGAHNRVETVHVENSTACRALCGH